MFSMGVIWEYKLHLTSVYYLIRSIEKYFIVNFISDTRVHVTLIIY